MKILKYSIWFFSIIILIALMSAYSFHFIPSESKVIPKEHLTLKNTLITDDDILIILEKYHFGTKTDKQSIFQTPIYVELLPELLTNWNVSKTENGIYFVNKDGRTIVKYYKG